jgi:hypothetical protein
MMHTAVFIKIIQRSLIRKNYKDQFEAIILMTAMATPINFMKGVEMSGAYDLTSDDQYTSSKTRGLTKLPNNKLEVPTSLANLQYAPLHTL